MKWTPQRIDCRWLRWDYFVRRLTTVLRAQAEANGRFVIVSARHPHRFVQFVAHIRASKYSPALLRGEAISNRFLEGEERLSKLTQATLNQLGWKPANTRFPNFWRTWPTGADRAEVSAVAVRTLREAFGITSPKSLSIECGLFASHETTAPSIGSGLGLPTLSVGDKVINPPANRAYRVGRPLGEGAFGAAYRVTQVAGRPKFPGSLCLKIAATPHAWHREAYFGQLLRDVSRAIAVHDSFATFVTSPASPAMPLYCLVTEFAKHGDLGKYLLKRRKAWTETRACREVSKLLRVLVHLHDAGAVHRDLTPQNVLVTAGEILKLGDFGIARHPLGRRAVRADVFNRWFAPTAIADGRLQSWDTADDVYQMGQILATLIAGTAETKPAATEVKALRCSARVKAIIQRAIGERRKRFKDAAAMLEAFALQDGKTPTARRPSSLAGKVVVFTGKLSITRRAAALRAKRAGALVRAKVTAETDVLVQGAAPAHGWKADAQGQKALDVDYERERGHDVRIIDERDFLTLVSRCSFRTSYDRRVASLRT